MADIDGLKRRIELIDLRLKTAHSTRERESAALADMWEQIRDRFESQKAEILSLRERIRILEDTRDDLQDMVDRLLGAVEGGLERMSDETITNIREMAGSLLEEGDSPAPLTEQGAAVSEESDAVELAVPAYADPENDERFPVEIVETTHRELVLKGEEAYPDSEDAGAPSDPDDNVAQEAEEDDFLAALERSANAVANNTYPGTPDDDDVLARDTPIDTPLSPGIRDLIARVEGSMGERLGDDSVAPAEGSLDASESPEELDQDLLEIEQLRNELLGLRERISGTGRG